ncbi:unnamed protein product [Kuraishia capsulata CBS 1993]|uniref:NTF2 domain-containing protein n=1 Tax=Kuraishia capsulata CBS 1993 TaxID=1382522 RepID=W6MPT6_9ASCO|nr:uncharacterized protein KUCA_T00004718001 [Kuraishia capsulata CBS 1993]CDK28734.1 unnamed protein product [Kuraishia capsulata CBS 1993]
MSVPEKSGADPNAIAYAFVNHYYTRMNAKDPKLSSIYQLNAVLTHSDPTDSFKAAVSVSGNKGIQEYLAKTPLAGCKVMISTVDVQPSFQDSILVICYGELALDDETSPAYKFVQTFVLVSSKPGVYDIFNDVLRFIPDVDDEVDVEEVGDSTEDSKVSNEVEEKEESAVFSPLQSKESTPETGLEESTTLEPPKEQPREEPKEEKKEEPVSWASKASAGITNFGAPVVVESPKRLAAKSAPAASASAPAAVETKAALRPASEESKKHKKAFLNGKGEPVYPIYVRGVKDISQADLLKALTSKFGKVDSCRIDRLVALVDFVSIESQKQAIKTGEIQVGTYTIRLEPRAKRDKVTPKESPKQQKPKKKRNQTVNDNDGFKKVGK